MNKSKIILLLVYTINVFLMVGVILFYTWLNSRLEVELASSLNHDENTEAASKFIERIHAGQISTEEYVEIFKAQFESEKTSYASKKALIELNSSIKEVIVLFAALQLFFITLYVMYRTKA